VFAEVDATEAHRRRRLQEDAGDAWKLGRDPIPDLTELLEQRGIKVLLLDLPDRVSGLTCFVERSEGNPVPVIVVNRRHTLERRRLTMAHELAHRLIWSEETSIDIEKAANRFAGAFLQPAEHVRREVGSHRNGFGVPEVLQTKRIYRVSAAAMVVRFRDLGIISPDTMAYIFQTVGRRWRTVEPMPLEASDAVGSLELPKRYERLCFRALAEGLIDLARAADLLSQSTVAVQRAMRGADAL
jgi:Zn-dependent peptidase ImmA (M78 family)